MNNQQNVLTIATGKPLYVALAVNLARSFYYWNKDTQIRFFLATDRPEVIPPDVAAFLHIIPLKENELGTSFSTKLHLDKLAPPGQTLFIDSDCLVYGELSWIFERFKGHAVSVIGDFITHGEWFGDIKTICNTLNVTKLPKFNGGIYYLENGPVAAQVYQTARNLEKQYDEIGFIRLRGTPNDEVLMAAAMELHGQLPIADDGTIMSDPQACRGPYQLDVIKGRTTMTNPPPPSQLHQDWYPHTVVHPAVVHFLGYYTQHYPYQLDIFRLEKALANKLNIWTELSAALRIKYPEKIKINAKNWLRPVYHTLFGARNIKQSDRA